MRVPKVASAPEDFEVLFSSGRVPPVDPASVRQESVVALVDFMEAIR